MDILNEWKYLYTDIHLYSYNNFMDIEYIDFII